MIAGFNCIGGKQSNPIPPPPPAPPTPAEPLKIGGDNISQQMSDIVSKRRGKKGLQVDLGIPSASTSGGSATGLGV